MESYVMKILFIILMMFSTLSFAKSSKTDSITKEHMIEGLCGEAALMAQTTMQARQGGVTLTTSLQNLNNSFNDSPRKSFFKAIIIDAYKEPLWQTEENKRNAVTEYSNKTYLICNDAFSKSLK